MSEAHDNPAQKAVDNAAENTREAVSAAGEAASGLVGSAAESTSAALASAATATGNAVDAAQQNVSTALRRAGETAADIRDTAAGTAKRHPLRTFLGLAAAAAIVGFVAGTLRAKRG